MALTSLELIFPRPTMWTKRNPNSRTGTINIRNRSGICLVCNLVCNCAHSTTRHSTCQVFFKTAFGGKNRYFQTAGIHHTAWDQQLNEQILLSNCSQGNIHMRIEFGRHNERPWLLYSTRSKKGAPRRGWTPFVVLQWLTSYTLGWCNPNVTVARH
jgi:hypothetical protein